MIFVSQRFDSRALIVHDCADDFCDDRPFTSNPALQLTATRGYATAGCSWALSLDVSFIFDAPSIFRLSSLHAMVMISELTNLWLTFLSELIHELWRHIILRESSLLADIPHPTRRCSERGGAVLDSLRSTFVLLPVAELYRWSVLT